MLTVTLLSVSVGTTTRPPVCWFWQACTYERCFSSFLACEEVLTVLIQCVSTSQGLALKSRTARVGLFCHFVFQQCFSLFLSYWIDNHCHKGFCFPFFGFILKTQRMALCAGHFNVGVNTNALDCLYWLSWKCLFWPMPSITNHFSWECFVT